MINLFIHIFSVLREQNEIIIKQNQMIVQEIVKKKTAEEEQLSENLLKPLTALKKKNLTIQT